MNFFLIFLVDQIERLPTIGDMLRLYGPTARSGKLGLAARMGAKSYSTAAPEATVSQRELREKAIAEALARDEEVLAKTRLIREFQNRSKESILLLNKTPSTLVNARSQKLQQQLDQLPGDKVKQLNEELEEFLNQHMNLPVSEVSTRPWFSPSLSSGSLEKKSDDGEFSKNIKSTISNSISGQYPNLKVSPDYKPYSEQELYLRQLNHLRQSGELGSDLVNIYKPRDNIRNPKKINDVTISTLLAAGCHLGHAKSSWRPTTQAYIYGEYEGIHLIDLNETITALKRAVKVIRGIANKGGIILFVGTSKNDELHMALQEAANRCQGYYISKRWIPGIVTNFTEVTKQIGGENKMEVDMANTRTDRELNQDSSTLIKPDLVVLLNPVENRNCIKECIKSRVPTIGLCDTDMEPSLLTYPIPCNDDSIRSLSLMLGVLSRAGEEGLGQRLDLVKNYQARRNKE